jgi:hypothetical protein
MPCPCQRGGEVPLFLKKSMALTKAVVNGPQALVPTSLETNGFFSGGYKATKRNKYYLKQLRKGKSIGFTMKASLKAKGLIPRNSKTMRGKKVVSAKYR